MNKKKCIEHKILHCPIKLLFPILFTMININKL